MGEKHTTSTECTSIRIAESSDMDGWKDILRPMCKVLITKIGNEVIYLPLYQRVGMKMVNGDQDGLWSSEMKVLLERIMKSWSCNFFNKDIEMSKQWFIILFLPLIKDIEMS